VEMKFEEEAEEFGPVHAWRLLHRSVVEDERVTVRCMGIQGRGVLVQTGRQFKTDDGEWSQPDYDPVQMVDDVLIMEYMKVEPSSIQDGNGQPVSITRQIVSRELVGTRMAKERFQPKAKGKKPAQPGPYDHLTITAGVVLTMETGPRPPIQVPTTQVPPTADA
jgi:hypothetical protein